MFPTEDDSLQPVSIGIHEETSCESSWADAVDSAVEELLPSVFA